MTAPSLNPLATSAFSKASEYDKHRPSFPPEAVQTLLEALKVAGVEEAHVVDLAAGTGKFTECLVSRDENYKITAVEPHDAMRGVLEEKQLKGVAVRRGYSTQIPLADEGADAVIAAQAFHWFANLESLKEIHRVLKLDGSFGMIWNVEDYNQTRSHKPTTKWEGKLKDLIWSLEDNSPRFRHEKWRAPFDDQVGWKTILSSANPLFSLPLGEKELKWTVWLPKEQVWQRFSTLSQIAMLEGQERERARKVFDDAMNNDDVETNAAGEIALHGCTVLAWTGKVPWYWS